jgi:dolichol kinase
MSISPRAEAVRKTIHLMTIFIPVMVWFLPERHWRWLLLLTLAVLIMDFARLGSHRFGRFFRSLLGPSLRHHEERELLGSSYLAISCTVAAFLFPREIAVASMGYLILGDGLAGLVGRSWGRVPLAFGKTLEGTLACLIANLGVGWLVLQDFPAVILGAAVGTLVEFIPLPVDDNLAIPILAGTVLWWSMLP